MDESGGQKSGKCWEFSASRTYLRMYLVWIVKQHHRHLFLGWKVNLSCVTGECVVQISITIINFTHFSSSFPLEMYYILCTFAPPRMYKKQIYRFAWWKVCSVHIFCCLTIRSLRKYKDIWLFCMEVTCSSMCSCFCTFQLCLLTEVFCFENWLDLLCNLDRDFLSDTICLVQIASGTLPTPTARVHSVGWPQISCGGLVSAFMQH